MQSGKLSHRIIIQSLVPVQNGTTGIVTDTWTIFATVWAEVRPASVREFVAAGIAESKITTAVKIRYLAGIKTSMCILHGMQIFNIEGVLSDPRSGMEYITLPCSEVIYG